MQTFRRQSVQTSRRGTLLPAIAIGLLVAAGGIALVLDQLWLSSAQSELQTSANAASLAAAQKLANEELLKPEFDSETWANAVRQTAAAVAGRNLAVGQPVFVSTEPSKDVRLGRPVIDDLTGQETYIETDFHPSSVIVMAHRDRESGNPVSLFMPYLTAQPYGDVLASSEASISNSIRAVRPLDHANVPAWPIAILEKDGDVLDDWNSTIETAQGSDNFGWDETKKAVIEEPDGLPEMVLKTGSNNELGNVRIVDLGTGFFDSALVDQFVDGFNWEHLQEFGSELGFEEGPLSLGAVSDFQGTPIDQLEKQLGQTRIVLLYERGSNPSSNDHETIKATRLVSIRLLSIQQVGDEIELIVQPTIIATRTAVLSDVGDLTQKNKYIYRLALTQ